ncbi:MAG: hypothetical protein PHN52_02025 [candidate division Zixibacteria bacterium]|nr:hypothetical protein [candidate division Zixibacteria bacterium]
MKNKLWFKLLLLIFFLAGNLTANSRLVLLDISTAPLPWNDSRLYQKFEKMLTRDENIRVQRTDNLPPSQLPFPHDRNNLDSLINWGLEMGGRYLLVVTVHSERLERHKSFNLPLIFHKYETVGIIEGDWRLLDLQRQKTLVAESFNVKLNGPRIFQGSMDDNCHDADIHLTAVEKVNFFNRLEEKLTTELVGRVRKHTGGR